MGIDGPGPVHENADPIPLTWSFLLTPNFSVDLVRTGNRVIVKVAGEVDLCTASRLAEELRRAQRSGRDVVVDLDRVGFMDCSGLAALVNAARSGPGRLCVTPGSPQVSKLLALTGVTALLDVVDPPPQVSRAAA